MQKNLEKVQRLATDFFCINTMQKEKLVKLNVNEKREHLVKKLCAPLQRGNSKPFYLHLKNITSNSDSRLRLISSQGKIT